MPRASEHNSGTLTKLLYVGDSGTGKTSSLCSLVESGYNVRVLDFDNLLAPLVALVKRRCPNNLNNLEFMPFRDKLKSSPNGPVVDGMPKAYIEAMKAIDKWEDGSVPSQWGPETVFVIDSLTMLSKAAYFWARGLQGASAFAEGVALKGVDGRNLIYVAQQCLINTISYITAEQFNCNVIVIAHIKYLERDGQTKGYPFAIGNAISPEIPAYFPSVALAQRDGDKRTIRTRSTRMFDLKNPRSFDMADQFEMDNGLAKFFEASRT
jgi:hypothetical protein